MHSLWKFEPTARWLHARLWGQGWRYAEYRRCFTARSRWAFSRRCFTDEMIALATDSTSATGSAGQGGGMLMVSASGTAVKL